MECLNDLSQEPQQRHEQKNYLFFSTFRPSTENLENTTYIMDRIHPMYVVRAETSPTSCPERLGESTHIERVKVVTYGDAHAAGDFASLQRK
jgi:hypothetical protein